MASDSIEPKSLTAGIARSPFAEGARRLGEVAETIKARQLAEHMLPTMTEPVQAPEDLWASRFGTVVIGPEGSAASPRAAPVPHARTLMPELSALKAPAMSVPQRPDVRVELKPAAMAERLGRAEKPKRSFLGRLFGRD